MSKPLKLVFFLLIFTASATLAGNKDRQGEAGASELLLNPWARSSGWDGLNTASIHGIEAINLNVAGLAFTRRTELVFAHTRWLQGSGINLSTFGFAQTLGAKGGVLGFNVMSIDFGDIPITTTSLPEGGTGTYSPQFINGSLSYAKVFSNSIYGGITARVVSEGIAGIGAIGVAFDAGIQYVTGPQADPTRIKFGISLRNIGTPMTFGGDGLSFRGQAPEGDYSMTLEQRSQGFELPSLLNIGGAYDFKFGASGKPSHRLTVAANFTSHSFSQDQIGAGLEYAFKEMFMIRGGYNYQNGLTDTEKRVTALTGISAGVSFEVPVKQNGPSLGIDYSYRTSEPFSGSHALGLRINL
ncbi:MAG: PorV/PorQ family protein [Chitinophagales bacterium]|nr:PorV/PorQ family protein [Chitinophagales bacterium]